MVFTPPQSPPVWNHSADDILKLTKEAIEYDRAIQDKVGGLDPKDCTFDSVFLTLVDGDTRIDVITRPLGFYRNVSPTKELRDASNEAESLLRDFGVESSMRLDVFKAKMAAKENMETSGQWDKLSLEQQRLVDKMILDGTRGGLALPEEKRTELTTLKKELSQACLEFKKNINEENGVITFTEEELKGVPRDVISGYKTHSEDGRVVYDVTYKKPDISPIFKFAEIPATRKRATESFHSRLAVNVPVLDKILELRRRIAGFLGYKTWADYKTEVKMIKTGKGIEEFVNDLEARLYPVGINDRKVLLALKKREHEEKGFAFDGEFYVWDFGYYDRKYIEESLSLDDMVVKEYFPVSTVVPAILGIYQNLLGVQFEAIQNASTWHPDVQAYSVWEKDAKDASGFIGYCYLDLFPREGKYSNNAVWGLLDGYELPNNARHYPLSVMVANLAKPTPDKPALMKHDNVVSFFHEMGHIFHGLLSKIKYSRFHGTRVARDFVEAPSQMLENWCWEPKVLKKMSSHYQTKEPLSEGLIQKIIQSRYVNIGLYYLRQLYLAKFDLKVHTDQVSEDYTRLWNTMRENISLVKHDKLCPGQGAFSHMINYDAGYYGYTYSLVFAADMYATVFKADPLDPARGKLYRDKVLRPGASRDEIDILKDFLGRPPDSKAFLEEFFGTKYTYPSSLTGGY